MSLNYSKILSVIDADLSQYLRMYNLKSMILGVSGGIDSTLVAYLASRVSRITDIPLIGRSLPMSSNKENEITTARLVGKSFCHDFLEVNLQSEFNLISSKFMAEESRVISNLNSGNIKARLRMIYLYSLASDANGIVLSTDNQTEYQLGFWTLHGDVGDFNPIFGLWKTEVYELCEYIIANENLTSEQLKAFKLAMELVPTDGNGVSESDLDQFCCDSYETVDGILKEIVPIPGEFFRGYEREEMYKRYPQKSVDRICQLHVNSRFKRNKLPICIKRDRYE